MNQNALILLALTGGVLLAVQGGFNARLGVLLSSPLLASTVAFVFSTLFALVSLIATTKQLPALDVVRSVPLYLWFTGAIFSVVGISIYYYTIPRLGISTMITVGLFGQLLFSAIAGHFGFFGMPVEPLDFKKILGLICMVVGLYFLQNQQT